MGSGTELGFGPQLSYQGFTQYFPSNWVNWKWIQGGVANFSFLISPNWLLSCPVSVH